MFLTDSSEDRTAAKLKGYSGYIKFTDGEVLYIKADGLKNDDDAGSWLSDMELRINSVEFTDCFPISGVALNRNCIKYIRRL